MMHHMVFYSEALPWSKQKFIRSENPQSCLGSSIHLANLKKMINQIPEIHKNAKQILYRILAPQINTRPTNQISGIIQYC